MSEKLLQNKKEKSLIKKAEQKKNKKNYNMKMIQRIRKNKITVEKEN